MQRYFELFENLEGQIIGIDHLLPNHSQSCGKLVGVVHFEGKDFLRYEGLKNFLTFFGGFDNAISVASPLVSVS